MPEGDTSHKHAASLQARLGGQKATAVFARGVEYRRLAGAVVAKAEAHGKHLYIDVGEARLHVHLGMYGRLFLQDPAGVTPFKAARAGLAIIGERDAAMFWRVPTVEVLRAALNGVTPAGSCRNSRPYMPRCTCRRASRTSMNRCLPCASAFATTAPARRRYSTPRAKTAVAFCPTSRASRCAACLWMVSPSGMPVSTCARRPVDAPARRH